jgi:hypothetical protein
MTALVFFAGMIFGCAATWCWCARDTGERAPMQRFVMLDQRAHERWKAMCALLGVEAKIVAPDSWRIIDTPTASRAKKDRTQ